MNNIQLLKSFNPARLVFGLLLLMLLGQATLGNAMENKFKPVWQESFIDSADGKLFFAKTGSGPAIFLIPGGPGGSSWAMRHSFEPLAKTFTLIAIDNIGRGRSDSLTNPALHSVARDAKDLEAVRAYLGFNQISVYGHSYGGMVAMQYALDFGQHVQKLMLGNSVHGATAWQQAIDDSNLMVQQLFPEHWQKLLALRAQGILSSDPRYTEIYDQTEGDFYVHDLNHPPAAIAKSKHKSDHSINPLVYQAFLGNDPEWRLAGSLAGVEFLPQLARLKMPVLVITGRFDRGAQPRFAVAIADAIKNAPVALAIFENSAHRPMREEPKAFLARVKSFMQTGQ